MDNCLQNFGVLLKKPLGHQSNKWSKRFFVLKDGFLFYYADNEKKEFEKKKAFNIHPKGAVPLGHCVVEPRAEAGHPFCIYINSNQFMGEMLLAAESEYDRDKWINMINKSSRVTWSSVELGENIIHQLENQGLQMMEEKQQYYDKLQDEAMALETEKLKTEGLEKMKEDLEKENLKMEQLISDLKMQQERLKEEMDDTASATKLVNEQKDQLLKHTNEVQRDLELLELEKQKILKEKQNDKSTYVSPTKEDLSKQTETLQATLNDIETKTQHLLAEKMEIKNRLQMEEQKAVLLEDEKKAIQEHAEILKKSIKDMSQQKAITEAELKEEIEARLEAEKRLKEADVSLKRLEKAVEKQINNESNANLSEDKSEVSSEMIADVKTLKRFFENIAFESTVEADKTLMIKTAIHHRKSCIRRAHTLKYDAQTKRKIKKKGKGLSGSCDALQTVAENHSPQKAPGTSTSYF